MNVAHEMLNNVDDTRHQFYRHMVREIKAAAQQQAVRQRRRHRLRTTFLWQTQWQTNSFGASVIAKNVVFVCAFL